jgi:hypothetical protein
LEQVEPAQFMAAQTLVTDQILFLVQLFLMVVVGAEITTIRYIEVVMEVQAVAVVQVVHLLVLVQRVKDIHQSLRVVEVPDQRVLLVLAVMALHHQLLDHL